MPSNQKPAYAIHGSLIPSGAKMQGSSIDAQVSAFNEKKHENPEVKESESKKAITREKSMSMQQITKGISLKTKVSISKFSRQNSSELVRNFEELIFRKFHFGEFLV